MNGRLWWCLRGCGHKREVVMVFERLQAQTGGGGGKLVVMGANGRCLRVVVVVGVFPFL